MRHIQHYAELLRAHNKALSFLRKSCAAVHGCAAQGIIMVPCHMYDPHALHVCRVYIGDLLRSLYGEHGRDLPLFLGR